MAPALLAVAEEERAAARALSDGFGDLMINYDADAGVAISLLASDQLRRALGGTYPDLPARTREGLYERVRICALLGTQDSFRAGLDPILHVPWLPLAFQAWAQIGEERVGEIEPALSSPPMTALCGYPNRQRCFWGPGCQSFNPDAVSYSSIDFFDAAVAERQMLLMALTPTRALEVLEELKAYRESWTAPAMRWLRSERLERALSCPMLCASRPLARFWPGWARTPVKRCQATS